MKEHTMRNLVISCQEELEVVSVIFNSSKKLYDYVALKTMKLEKGDIVIVPSNSDIIEMFDPDFDYSDSNELVMSDASLRVAIVQATSDITGLDIDSDKPYRLVVDRIDHKSYLDVTTQLTKAVDDAKQARAVRMRESMKQNLMMDGFDIKQIGNINA